MLYKSEVTRLIPDGVSKEDSLRLAMQYINSWASDMVFLDIAEKQLSKAEKDVSKELEAYRRSLLKFRYEQLYVNERLDTAVTESEITRYYEAWPEQFVLDVPIVKARYMRISADSPNLALIKKKMASTVVDDLVEADSLAYFSADTYTDYSGKWITVVMLARNFGVDYGTLMSRMDRSMVEMKDNSGKLNVAYIEDYIAAGETAPLEYCRDRIRDIIISVRKQTLINELERDLLEDARSKGKFEIL